jgi:L-histidine N-alpha-methyltransferase
MTRSVSPEVLRQSAATPQTRFAADVRAGLGRSGQKELPSKYLYDAVGSALFDVICLLPEYGLTRAGERLLSRHAQAIIGPMRKPALVAELGSGSARKTRWILEALSGRHPTVYCPIDISGAALEQAERELNRLESVNIVGLEREYLDGLREVAAGRRDEQHLLVLFLGGTIGNFDREAADRFLAEVRQAMKPDDRLLLATDLEKPESQLIRAYDDPIGVTSAFNLNLLARINRELDADVDLDAFAHQARYDRRHRRVEMHLRSTRRQTVRIPGADLSVELREGETIWTESSYKFSLDEIPRMAQRSGFHCESQWVDREWPFAQNLLAAV